MGIIAGPTNTAGTAKKTVNMVEDNLTLPDTGIVVITITNKRSEVVNYFNGFTVGIGFTTYKACAKQYEAFSPELKHDMDKITRAIGDAHTIGVKFMDS